MAKNRIHFTQALIDGLPPAVERRCDTYYDDSSRGLCVLITRRGVKSFYVLRKFKGRTERVLLGRFPDTTVSFARRRAGEINARFDAGSNANDIRRRDRQELTLQALHMAYMENHARPRNRRPEVQAYHYKLYLAHWSHRRLSQITKLDVQAWHARLGDTRGQRTANIALGLLRSLYNRAIEWDLFEGLNPTAGTRKFKEKARERFLLPGELKRFLTALKEEPTQIMRDFFLTLLLTGARKGNVLTMRWRDVHLDSAVWVIPDTKTGDSQTLPLSPQAQAVLLARWEQRGTEVNALEWVFPGTGRDGHLEDPKRAWTNLLARTKIRDCRMHDLRRTHASYMAGNGVNQFVISRALGHKSLESTAIYARLDLDPIRTAATTAATVMLQGVDDLLPALPEESEVGDGQIFEQGSK